MALCNTVHYSYGKYMKDKVRHYKLWQNMLDNQSISQKHMNYKSYTKLHEHTPLNK